MNMILKLLDSETKEHFEFMDPFEKMDMLALPGSFGLGVFAEEEKEDVPAGHIICSEEDDRLYIDWLYVRPEYRGQGIASELMYLSFEEGAARGSADVAARISDEFEEVFPEWDTWGFFENDVFSDVEDDESVLRLGYADLSKLLVKEESLNAKAAGNKGISILSDVSDKEKGKAVKDLKARFGKRVLVPIEQAFAMADADMSFLLKSGDEYTGAFFMRKTGRTWYPYLLEAAGIDEMELLARAALYNSEDCCTAKDKIEIRIQRPVVRELIDKLQIPGEEYRITNLVADMNAFIKQKRHAENTEKEN